ncbi:MAG: HTH domain-containing protein [Desulfosporosinus sp.]|nr:HTH domain-containing protein [Desulfosporosinus sp.]
MTFLEMARSVLEKAKAPLTPAEIWNKGLEFGLTQQLKSTGKTPVATIGAQLYVNIRDNPKSDFCKYGERPTRFALSAWNEKELSVSEPVQMVSKQTFTYKERDLHQILAYFAYYHLNVITSTINDKISKNDRKGRNEWQHPDMVGLDISSIKDFNKGVLSFSKQINQTPIGVFSFELKRMIEFSNLRESYFQAVSNSRWANKGYLVCAELDLDDGELIGELGRLAAAYGIGVIKLDLTDPDDSKILFEAHYNKSIEWGFVNYLFGLNEDYKTFIEASADIIKTEQLYREKFDRILSREEVALYAQGLK